ncbi:MAG: hypothetical protein QM752_02050 [Gammaproteobacteria bacterium]
MNLNKIESKSQDLLSTNKKKFLSERKEFKTATLSLRELPLIARDYKEKYKIDIIINAVIRQGENLGFYSRQRQLWLDQLTDKDLNYAGYIMLEFRNYMWKPADFKEKFPETPFPLMQFLEENWTSLRDLEDLQKNLQKLCLSSPMSFREKVDEEIAKKIKLYEFERDYPKMFHGDMIKEVQAIQASLQEGELRGYVFWPVYESHTEVLIIAKDKMIKPVYWPHDPFKKISEERCYILPEHFSKQNFMMLA